jgi:hypothetical protein
MLNVIKFGTFLVASGSISTCAAAVQVKSVQVQVDMCLFIGSSGLHFTGEGVKGIEGMETSTILWGGGGLIGDLRGALDSEAA